MKPYKIGYNCKYWKTDTSYNMYAEIRFFYEELFLEECHMLVNPSNQFLNTFAMLTKKEKIILFVLTLKYYWTFEHINVIADISNPRTTNNMHKIAICTRHTHI